MSAAVFQTHRHEAGSSAQRYPLLSFYLRTVRIGTILLGIGGALASVVLLLLGIMMATQSETASSGVSLFFSGLAVAIATFVQCMGALALIQFMYVILDMEQHLRLIAQRGVEFPSS